MNTNNIKSFAQQARLLLLEGVRQRLMYWGFDAKGNNSETLETTHGGYIFRGEIHTDSTVPEKWNALRKRLTDKQSVNDVIEEAAYTWFNRLMAIKILEENQYLDPTLQFAEGVHTPMLVQNAKQGNHTITSTTNRNLLIDLLKENQEEQAFALLITNLCNKNRLLHDVFGRINDYTELLLPQNILQKDGLIDLINNGHIEKENYQEVELIGWLYQFYISDKKAEVSAGFKKNIKARAEDIPAATQFFTPKWIVKYMVENTVGKIYLDYETDSDLRSKMKYLVEQGVDDRDQGLESSDSPLTPHPLPLINDITELTLLDPACGSGHILVTGFELLFEMYLEVGYTARNAVNNILEHNLFGLDIDDRAMQLARFAVLLKGAELLKGNGSGSSISREFMTNPSLIPHVYSFPEKQSFESEELQSFLGADGQQYSAELRDALTLLNQGKNIGSALKIDLSDEAVNCLEKQYNDWQQKQQTSALDIQELDIWNRLQPMLDVLIVLAKKYSAVVANPPYMGPRAMNNELKTHIDKNYPLTKSDLFAVFIEVCLQLTKDIGLMSMINQESWLFNYSYRFIRKNLSQDKKIESLLHLGTRAFDEVSGEKVRSVAFVIANKKPKSSGTYFRLTDYNTTIKKKTAFLSRKNIYKNVDQSRFKEIEGTPYAYWISSKVLSLFKNYNSLDKYSSPRKGNSTSDNKRFLRLWYEVDFNNCALNYSSITQALESAKKWIPYNKGGGQKKWYGYNDYLIDWTDNGKPIREIPTAVVTNEKYYMKPGLTWSAISGKTFGLRYFNKGFIFDNNGCCLFDLENNKNYIAGLLNSKVFFYIIGQLNPALAFHPGDVKKFPVILEKKSIDTIANYYISKKDWDSRETSWDFEQSPLINQSSSLKDSYKQWEKDVTNDFFQLHANEEELNRIFIDIYGLQDELTPEVALKDITILQDELDRKALDELEPIFREQGKEAVSLPIDKAEIISQFISYAIGVFMGRYRLDKPGLNIAHPNPTEEETKEYLVIRDKGLGATAQELILNYIRNEYPEFSRSVGLAKSDELNSRSVSYNSNISERGDVWAESSIEEGGSIYPEQHSRGTSTRDQRVSSLSENSEGFSSRSRDTIGNSSSAKLSSTRQDETTDDANNRNIKNAEWVKQQAESLMQELGIREQGLVSEHSLTPNPSFLTSIKIDEDGIIPLMGRDCAFPDDALNRTTDLVNAVWGEGSLTENINFIHNALGMDLHSWLTERFWNYHISGKMYKKKPIYWLFSSNARRPQNAAFKVLVYMHRMDRYTISKIQRNYLYPHQEYISGKIERLVANEANLSREDLKLLELLRKWEIECRDYNEVLKELAYKEIEFDLDDGVTQNYKLFEGAVAIIK